MLENAPDSFTEESPEDQVFHEPAEIGSEIFEEYEAKAQDQDSHEEIHVIENPAETPVAEGEHGEEQLDPGAAILKEILKDNENFEAAVLKASPSELVLLSEVIARENDVPAMLNKVRLVRTQFDKLSTENPDSIPQGLIGRMNTAIARFNKKRVEYFAQLEKEKGGNTKLKQELLDRLKKIVESASSAAISEVREIQTRWKEIGWVSNDVKQQINETYKYYLDTFYTQRSKENELRDMDRKHNLDEKLAIVRDIEALIPDHADIPREAWNEYSNKLKNLQEIWKTIGPVPRDNVDEINEKLKNALDTFYGLRQEYYNVQDNMKEENTALKKAIIEKMNAYLDQSHDKPKDWNQATVEILALKEEWSKTGPAPYEVNRKLWKEYRAICDKFFELKGEFFKKFDHERLENLKKKTAICEQAEAAIESDNMKETARLLKQLQNEWKLIGPVHERFSNKLWKRFRTACDEFFARREKAMGASSEEQQTNLAAKETMIARLKEIMADKNQASFADEVKEMQVKWRDIGHVPFDKKEILFKEYKELMDTYFTTIYSKRPQTNTRHKPEKKGEKKVAEFSDNKDDKTKKIRFEISKLRERLATTKEKVDSYETNIMLISKGKSGDGLRTMIQAQINEEKEKIVRLTAEIKAMNEILNPPKTNGKEKPIDSAQGTAKEEVVVEEKSIDSTSTTLSEQSQETPVIENAEVNETPSDNPPA